MFKNFRKPKVYYGSEIVINGKTDHFDYVDHCIYKSKEAVIRSITKTYAGVFINEETFKIDVQKSREEKYMLNFKDDDSARIYIRTFYLIK